MNKKMKKLVAVLSAASIVLTIVSVPVSAKKKTVVTPKPKIVSLKYSTYNNMKAGKQTIKISWNAVKTTGRVDILNAKKKVINTRLWQKKITKKGSATVSWGGENNNDVSVASGTYYVKFTLGKKSVVKKFAVKSVPGLITFKNLTMQCPAGYTLSYFEGFGASMFESNYSSKNNVELLAMEIKDKATADMFFDLFTKNPIDESGKTAVSNVTTDVTIQDTTAKKVDIKYQNTSDVLYYFTYKSKGYIFSFNYKNASEEAAAADIQSCVDHIVFK